MGGGNLVGSEIGGGERRMWEDCLLAVCPTGGKRKGGRGEGGSTDFLPLGRRVCSFLILLGPVRPNSPLLLLSSSSSDLGGGIVASIRDRGEGRRANKGKKGRIEARGRRDGSRCLAPAGPDRIWVGTPMQEDVREWRESKELDMTCVSKREPHAKCSHRNSHNQLPTTLVALSLLCFRWVPCNNLVRPCCFCYSGDDWRKGGEQGTKASFLARPPSPLFASDIDLR